MIRAALIGGVATVAACAACRTQPTAPAPTPTTVAANMVEAGCVLPSSTLATSIASDETSDAEPGWMQCLFEGGTISACGTPCLGDP